MSAGEPRGSFEYGVTERCGGLTGTVGSDPCQVDSTQVADRECCGSSQLDDEAQRGDTVALIACYCMDV